MDIPIQRDEHNLYLYWWTPGKTYTWTDFHVGIDKLSEYADSADQSITIILHPTADIPSGSPFPHFKRLMTTINRHQNIDKFYLVMESKFIVGQAIMKITETVVGFGNTFEIVKSRQAALDRINQAKG